MRMITTVYLTSQEWLDLVRGADTLHDSYVSIEQHTHLVRELVRTGVLPGGTNVEHVRLVLVSDETAAAWQDVSEWGRPV